MSLSSLALDSNPIRVPQTPFLGARHHHLRPIILPRRPNLIICSSASASASLSVAKSSTTQGTNWIGSLSQVLGVLGCQWGEEGKGKLVDILAHHFDIVARCQVHFFPDLLAVGWQGRNQTSPVTSQPLSLSKLRSSFIFSSLLSSQPPSDSLIHCNSQKLAEVVDKMIVVDFGPRSLSLSL